MKLRLHFLAMTAVLLWCAGTPLVRAQDNVGSASKRYEIRLKSGVFTPQASSTEATTAAANDRHALIQFNEAIDASDLARLQDRGIRVAGFVPNNAVVAFVPATVDMAGLENVRWIGGLRPEDKLSPQLDLSGIAGFSVVFLHRGTDPDLARAAIGVLGAEVVNDPRFPTTALLVRAGGETLRSIAALDVTSYIHRAPENLQSGRPIYICPGPMTQFGYVPEFVTQGEGWDGPGQGSASLTYFFENGTPDVSGEEAEVLRALNIWASYASISWSTAANVGAIKSFDIKWASGDHGDGAANAFDGPSGVLAHCYYPFNPSFETIAGNMHFDEAETWRVGSDIDVFTVALHEAGHGLGLNHSTNPLAVMAPYYGGPVSDLRQDDIDGIRALYASVNSTRTSAPVFDPAPGFHPSPLEVRLQFGSGSNASNTQIFYTLDGTDPIPTATSSSFAFVPGTAYIFLRNSGVVRARAFRDGFLPSDIVVASYTLSSATPVVATPVITPAGGSHVGSVQVSIDVSTDFAIIRLTQDGSEPTETSQAYGGPFPVTTSQTVRAKAFRTGYAPSQTASATFNVTQQGDVPTIFPPSGVFQNNVTVYMSSNTPGAIVRYTLNGTTPTAASTAYAVPLQITATTTVKAVAFVSGGSPSGVATSTYVIGGAVAKPTITPNGGGFTGSVQVSMSTVTPGATIHYTTNGANPTEYSTAYSSPFTLGVGTHTVKARAYLEGASESDLASAQFQVYVNPTTQVETPTITPFNGQQFVTGFLVTMDCRTEGATIRWSQGTNILPPDPTESGNGGITYTGPFQWNAGPNTYFFKVKAFKNGLAASQTIQTGGLTISTPAGTVTTPTITPNGGTFANPVQVTLATTTQSALIAYTDDGTDPSTVLPILPPTRNYNGNLTLSSSKTIKAKGYRTFFLESGLATADFVFQCGTPVFASSSGDYVDSVVVSLTSETTGGNTKIRYTVDGSDPTESSAEYSGPFALGIGNHSVRARVFRFNFLPSTVASAEYSVAAVAAAPQITQGPLNQSVAEGTTANFQVSATGTPAPSYQWRRNGVNLPGENAASLTLENVQTGDAGAYTVAVSNSAGSVTSSPATLTVTPTTDVREVGNQPTPTEYALHANYPNPFNPSTVIRYAVPQAGEVRLEIYNSAGQRVRTLVKTAQSPGNYEATWDARNGSGAAVASGIYVYRLVSGSFSQTRKMVLLK